MTPTTKRSSVDLADKRAARIPSLVADLASPDPTVRTKARKALVALGKLSRAFTHSTPFASKATRAMGSSQGAVRHRRSACRFRAGQCLGRPRWRRALAGGRGGGRSGPRGLQPLLAALLQRAESCWFCEGAHHVCHTLVKRKRLGPILRPVLAALKESEPEVAVPRPPMPRYRDCESCREDTAGIGQSTGRLPR